MSETSNSPYRVIDRAAQIEVLASPIRQEIVDTLAALGGQVSTAELALQLGRHADGLYYHLKVLCKAGLITESAAGEEEARRYALPGEATRALRLAYRTDTTKEKQALRKFARALLKVAQEDFEEALDMPDLAASGDARELWASRSKAWLSREEVMEVNGLLQRLCELMSQPRTAERDRILSCTFVLAPHIARPKRRGAGEAGDADPDCAED
ncbi:winged helix-turn-helix domain-containing protein [Massilia sp. DD77]|uniref:winged helix-turn-helix domain-containing protein n=1 Tax=Massilia sp. DD77 TaxID=3109349 RepID=UPI002FFEAFC0